ncbi:DUF4267 domain-containing protein [Streptomyces sp. NPDC057596]|uniref:DUF4267 domain-containing protein n=1 Tax=Streptomyces sp. NPDC057596 TaxID=3346178 RepID=UPI00368542A3
MHHRLDAWRAAATRVFSLTEVSDQDQSHSLMTAIGEIACGVFVFVLMLVATTSLLGWYLMALAAIPAGDAVVVLRSGEPKAAAYGIHGATAVVMLATSIGLLV